MAADDFSDLSYLAEFANVYKRYLTDIEFEYLLSLYPFIELINPDHDIAPAKPATYSQTKQGWVVKDTGNNLLLGPGNRRFGARIDDDDDVSGGGSLLMQGILSVESLMLQAIENWGQVIVGNGYYPLRRMAWMVGLAHGVHCQGFSPTYDDYMAKDSIQLAQDKPMHEILGPTP